MKKNSLIVIFIMVVFSVSNNMHAAGVWDVASKEELIAAYDKASKWFSNTVNYKVDVQYLSFSSHSSLTPSDKSDGIYKRNNTHFYSSALGVNTLQNEKMKVTVDTAEKIIILNNKIRMDRTPVQSNGLEDLLEEVKSFKKQAYPSGEKMYRIEFLPNQQFSAYEFKINDKGLLIEIKYYYSQELQENTEDKNSLKSKPRVEIRFHDYQTGVDFNYEKEFSEKKYFKEIGKEIILNKEYLSFELKDYRFAEKK